MHKLYATKGQTQVMHDGKVYDVKNGVVEVDEALVPLFKTLGFLEEKDAKAAKAAAEKEEEEDETPQVGHHQSPQKKK